MFVFKSKTPVSIKWKNLLVSRADFELCKIFGLHDTSEIYKVKHYFYNGTSETAQIPIFGETYFPISLFPIETEFTDNMTLQELLNKILPDIKFKTLETKISLRACDQVLSAEMNCPFYENLFCMRQIITNKSKVICVNTSYINAQLCDLCFEASPQVIFNTTIKG